MTGSKLFFVRMVLAVAGVSLAGQLSGVAVASAANSSSDAVLSAEQSPGGRGSSGGRTAPNGIGWKWWNDAEVQQELALSAEKVKQINDYYEKRNADLRPVLHDFMQQSAELDKMTRDRVVDESTYVLQVMRVEAGRSRLGESRTVMLYRMFRQLTPDQHQKLQGILDRRYNRGGQGRSSQPR